MQDRFSAGTSSRGPWSGVRSALQGVTSWVLDQPAAPVLHGQSCDRLRPSFLLCELEQALLRLDPRPMVMVDWRWDQRLGRADGYIWHDSQLQRFNWWRNSDRLELHALLLCTPIPALRVAT